MNILPKELEDIIYEYIHQLKMNDIMDELCDTFSMCDYCKKDKPENYLFLCQYCSIEFCKDCQLDLKDKENKFCNECYFEQLILLKIKEMINRNYIEDELGIIIDLVTDLDEYDRKDVFLFLNFLHGQGRFKKFKRLVDELTKYIYNYL